VRTVVEHATGIGDAVRRAGQLSARTVIFDVEPLVAYWDGTQETLDEGIARVLSEIAELPTVEVVCFSTNSPRRPSAVPSAAGVRVVYLASAGKPLRTTPYQGFPRPAAVVHRGRLNSLGHHFPAGYSARRRVGRPRTDERGMLKVC
jgi:hypothetical protein